MLMALTVDVSKLDTRLIEKKIGKENLQELRNLLKFLESKGVDLSKLVLGGGVAVSMLLNFENLRYQLSKTDVDLIYPGTKELEKILAYYPREIKKTGILDSGEIVLGSTEMITREKFLEDVSVLKIINQNIELDVIEGYLLAARYIRVPTNQETLEAYTRPIILKFSEDESYRLRIVSEKLALYTQLLLLTGIDSQDAVRIFRILELLKQYPNLSEPASVEEFFRFAERYKTSDDELLKQYKLIYATLSKHKWKNRFIKEAPEWYAYFMEELARKIIKAKR
jgi:hypothetical protein